MKINKDMSITEILQKFPETQSAFTELNLGCLGCIAASFETLEAGISAHGLNIEEVLVKLNDAVISE